MPMHANSVRLPKSKRGPAVSRRASFHNISPSTTPPSSSSASSSSSSSSSSSLSLHSFPSPADGSYHTSARPSSAVFYRKTKSESHRHDDAQGDVSGNPGTLMVLPRMKSAADVHAAATQLQLRGEQALLHASTARLNREEAVQRGESWKDANSKEAVPDLLQLFSIFEFNKPEGAPRARTMVNVTLIGGHVEPIRLRITFDATVEDVIKASLDAYRTQGRLPRHPHAHPRSYGLHYSPFSLECIDPKEVICGLGARHFFLSPSRLEPMKPSDICKERKSCWNLLKLLLPLLTTLGK